MQPVRHVKVSYATHRRSLPTVHCNAGGAVVREGSRSVFQTSPLLRLRGQWLAEAGFAIGDKVTVAVSEGRLVITPEGGEER